MKGKGTGSGHGPPPGRPGGVAGLIRGLLPLPDRPWARRRVRVVAVRIRVHATRVEPGRVPATRRRAPPGYGLGRCRSARLEGVTRLVRRRVPFRRLPRPPRGYLVMSRRLGPGATRYSRTCRRTVHARDRPSRPSGRPSGQPSSALVGVGRSPCARRSADAGGRTRLLERAASPARAPSRRYATARHPASAKQRPQRAPGRRRRCRARGVASLCFARGPSCLDEGA